MQGNKNGKVLFRTRCIRKGNTRMVLLVPLRFAEVALNEP
jgi:hypothetical protein